MNSARILSLALLFVSFPVNAAEPSKAQTAAERGLKFLQADAAAWKKERQCSTCHHGTFTLWALLEAKKQGYAVSPEAVTETTVWLKERLQNIDKPRDTRPGWSMVNSIALNLSLMASAIDQKEITADELKRIGGHLLRHQEEDGSWAWSSAPAKNRPPPFFESDEVATLLGYLALNKQLPPKTEAKSDVRDSYEKAGAWLAKAKPTDTTQAAAYRLLVKARTEPKDLQKDIVAFLKRRNKDGGWGQIPNAASDAYATGQALYVLSLAGVKSDREEIRGAVAYLVSSQKEDGSWPMVRRGHEGVTPGPFTQPIVYFGSAWATLGLMRTNPVASK